MKRQNGDVERAEYSLDRSKRLFEALDSAFKLSQDRAMSFALEVQALRTRAGAFVDHDEVALHNVLERAEQEEEEE